MRSRFKCLSLLLTLQLGFSLTSLAEENVITPDVKGIWYRPGEVEDPSFQWQARWIWAEEESNTEMLLARRIFRLDQMPEKAVLRITASSMYQFYLNGQYICRGPARSAPHHQAYDILDITETLKEGENLIAVRVHHQDGKKSYQYDGRAGLLVQLNLGKEQDQLVIASDDNWKVIADPSWDNNAPLISRFQQVVSDRVDFRNYLVGWNRLEFDDSSWNSATELMRTSGWPSPQRNAQPQALTPPWTSLIPRDIPYLIESEIAADKLIQSSRTKTLIDEGSITIDGRKVISFASDKTLELPATMDGESWLLLFDFGTVINGMPQLNIEGESGTQVKIVTAPFMVDHQFSRITVDSEFMDEIVLSAAQDRWEATYFKPTRYMGIIVNNKSPIKLHFVGMLGLRYPFERIGVIESKDAPWVKHYFDAAAKTIDVCTTDGYTDNYRERRQYAQTGYYSALGNYYAFGDVELQRRYLIQTSQEQLANGIMPAYAPLASDDYMIILDSNCLWIRSLYNYYLYTGDELTVRKLLPAGRKLMVLLHSYTSKLGMIENPPYAYWLDHALNDRRGANFTLNGHYLGALEDFAMVLDWLDEPDAAKFTASADVLRQSLQTYLWDETKGLFADAYVDGEQSDMFSEHANAMALAMQIATPDQVKKVAEELLVEDQHNYIKRTSGTTMVTPAMSYFLHKGLCANGYIEPSFKLFRDRFDKMLQPGTNGTLWEEWWLDAIGRSGKLQKGRTRSDAQTESAFPPALFAEYLLGITPTQPGMKEVVLALHENGLEHIKGIVPSPLGELTVEWQLKKQKGEITLEIPDGMILKLDTESFGFKLSGQVVVNKKPKEPNPGDERYIYLEGGRYLVEF